MALSNELSSEIAAALLSAANRSPRELKDLQEVVFKVHTVLMQMNEAERRGRKSIAGRERNNSAAAATRRA
jgi:hypothetical protein